MRRLRYIGPVTTEFFDGDRSLGEVAPGGAFEVPDEIAERFTRRSDVEDAEATTVSDDESGYAPATPAPDER